MSYQFLFDCAVFCFVFLLCFLFIIQRQTLKITEDTITDLSGRFRCGLAKDQTEHLHRLAVQVKASREILITIHDLTNAQNHPDPVRVLPDIFALCGKGLTVLEKDKL